MEPRGAITSRDGVGSVGQMPRGVGARVRVQPGLRRAFPRDPAAGEAAEGDVPQR